MFHVLCYVCSVCHVIYVPYGRHAFHSLIMCVCVCMYVCMTACMYVCMHVCMHACICVCVCVYACMYACIYKKNNHAHLLRLRRHSLGTPSNEVNRPSVCAPINATISCVKRDLCASKETYHRRKRDLIQGKTRLNLGKMRPTMIISVSPLPNIGGQETCARQKRPDMRHMHVKRDLL